MQFNSLEFLIFFPIVVIVYYTIPAKIRYLWLLISSYYFYMNWNWKYAFLLFFSTMITYISGIFLERAETANVKKIWVGISLVLNLGILAVF